MKVGYSFMPLMCKMAEIVVSREGRWFSYVKKNWHTSCYYSICNFHKFYVT